MSINFLEIKNTTFIASKLNKVLDFKDDTECLLCLNIKKCVKFRKCPHYACLTCFPKYHKCPTCFILKEADTQVNNG